MLRLSLPLTLFAALATLTSCDQPSRGMRPELPLLPPAALGRNLHADQLLSAEYDGQSWSMQGAVEVTASEVRLVGLNPLGQRIITLRWDGVKLMEERDKHLPERIKGERILGDVQLIYWPRAALNAALPDGWSVEDKTGERIVQYDKQPFARIRCDGTDPWQGRCVFEQQRHSYRLTIHSTVTP